MPTIWVRTKSSAVPAGRSRRLVWLLAATALGCGTGDVPQPSPAPTAGPAALRPDIVLVLTDDLDTRTARRLPRLTSFAESGIEFTESFVTQAVCGPSRVSLLTGQYPHNHGATVNIEAFPRFWASGGERSTIATWLRDAGYRTALLGKYLNGYPNTAAVNHVPPGWDEWYVHLMTTDLQERYFTYTLNENGTLVDYGGASSDYDTDVFAQKSSDFIRRHAVAHSSAPLFLVVSLQAPHTPASYAPRHGHLYLRNEGEVERVPSFNEAYVDDKPAWVQNTPLLTSEDERRIDLFQQARLRSMAAVEELLDSVVAELRAQRPDRPHYVFFTSDNGLLLGEHRIAHRKGNPYEESIRVPLYVAGTGIAPLQASAAFALNIDLAPTFLDLASVPIPGQVDGRSLAPFLRGQKPPSWRADFLVEDLQGDLTGTLRTKDWSYTEWGSGELELYDMNADPWQMDSIHRKAEAPALEILSRRLHALEACRGATCRD